MLVIESPTYQPGIPEAALPCPSPVFLSGLACSARITEVKNMTMSFTADVEEFMDGCAVGVDVLQQQVHDLAHSSTILEERVRVAQEHEQKLAAELASSKKKVSTDNNLEAGGLGNAGDQETCGSSARTL